MARRTPLTAAQQALAGDQRHLDLASRIARRFGKMYPRLADEFRSEANLALCTAARTFIPARKVSFFTHATNRIHGAMLDVLRQSEVRGYRRRSDRWRNEGKTPRVRSLDAKILRVSGQSAYDGFWTDATIGYAIESEDEPIGWEIEAHEELKRLTRTLPVKHRTVLRLLYGHAETKRMKITGQAVGLSESGVSCIHSEAIAMLRG